MRHLIILILTVSFCRTCYPAAAQKNQSDTLQDELQGITVKAEKLVETDYGVKNSNGLIQFSDGSTDQTRSFEIAQLARLDTILSKITSVNLYINESRPDSASFRIHFYSFSDSGPGTRILSRSITQTKPVRKGWMKFDLTKELVYLKGDIIIAIEFATAGKSVSPIAYGIKLGGSARSYVRTGDTGEWRTPPHHYRMYITALVNKKRHAKQEPPEDVETKPAFTVYSTAVKDSFSIFVSLPAAYTRAQYRYFPVIYLLDANVYFDAVNNALQESNAGNAILIGISYRDFFSMDSLRARDYTYPQALATDSFHISGGANRFLEFIQQELTPLLQNNYRIDTGKRTLMGHSLGGYFTLYALLQSLTGNRQLFHYYVAASPSIDYGDGYLSKQFATIDIPQKGAGRQTLMITYGADEDKEDYSGTLQTDHFNEFSRIVSKINSLSVISEIYPGRRHMETALPSFVKGLSLK